MMANALENFDADFAGPGDWAAMYRACGLQVIPCFNPDEVSVGVSWKRPRLSEWTTLQENLIPDASFDRWYGRGGEYASRQNMGILTGHASGNVFVIDIDDQKGPSAGNWWLGVLAEHNSGIEPETWRQRTGGGGRQILFKARPDWHAPTNRTPIGVDIRGQGGFAVMPSSLHESGRHYEWFAGCAPYEIEIAVAPEWLLSAVEKLVEQYGGDKGGGQRKAEQTSSPGNDFDNFGNRVDGRESEMRDVVWRAVLEWYRDCPIKPEESEWRARAEAVYLTYESGVKSRLEGTNKTELLEREGRGPSAFWDKWRREMAKWGSPKMVAEAAKPNPNQHDEQPRDHEAEFETASAKAEEQAKTDPGALFEYLNVSQIKNMPDPEWLVSGLVIEQALGFIYGPPGCLKTFIALGMGLSFAVGMPDWWGRTIERQGAVVYISSEGQSDLKFRIQAWEQKNQVLSDDSPFYLIRQTINFMKADDVGKLLATVQAISTIAGVKIAAVFVDTVSRTLPGADENLQKDMTLFVAACDAVRLRFGATVIGVHHTSRNGNMRGSTVFPGAGDFLVEVNREEGAMHGSIKATKIKAAEDGWEQHFKVEQIQLADIGGHKSLVVEPTDAQAPQERQGWPDITMCRRVKNFIGEAWDSGNPLSNSILTKASGRYAPAILAKHFDLDIGLVQMMLQQWLEVRPAVLSEEISSAKTKKKGLKVVGEIG
jgi:hypothetical protein